MTEKVTLDRIDSLEERNAKLSLEIQELNDKFEKYNNVLSMHSLNFQTFDIYIGKLQDQIDDKDTKIRCLQEVVKGLVKDG